VAPDVDVDVVVVCASALKRGAGSEWIGDQSTLIAGGGRTRRALAFSPRDGVCAPKRTYWARPTESEPEQPCGMTVGELAQSLAR